MKRHKSKYDIILRRLHLRIYAFSPAWWLVVLLAIATFFFALTAYIEWCLYIEAIYIK